MIKVGCGYFWVMVEFLKGWEFGFYFYVNGDDSDENMMFDIGCEIAVSGVNNIKCSDFVLSVMFVILECMDKFVCNYGLYMFWN